ncbi:hypothetical protein LZ30DRAFT_784703 [Colletotrichum cereale]|nr:hypothetical protein LZ30DRAFT_784703 [Colletotrichum cereale]
MDTHPDNPPAAATTANNTVRYLVSARATAVAVPLVERIGIGWTSWRLKKNKVEMGVTKEKTETEKKQRES